MKTSITFLAILALVAMCFAVPTSMSIHGKLTNASGVMLSGTYNMSFYIYNVTTNGTALYSMENTNITTDNKGIYSVQFDNLNLTFLEPYYLGVVVANDSEMSPRINITTSPYSFRANSSDYLEANRNYTINELMATNIFGSNICYSNGTNCTANATTNTRIDSLNITVLSLNNYSFLQIANNIGNWSADKSSYATTSYVTSIGNWTLDKTNVAFQNQSNTFQADQTINGTLFFNTTHQWIKAQSDYYTEVGHHLDVPGIVTAHGGLASFGSLVVYGDTTFLNTSVIGWDNETFALDTFLYRKGAGVLATNGSFLANNLCYSNGTNCTANATTNLRIDSLNITMLSLNNYSFSQIVSNIGNWTLDKTNVAFTNQSNTFTANQNITQNLTIGNGTIYWNGTALIITVS